MSWLQINARLFWTTLRHDAVFSEKTWNETLTVFKWFAAWYYLDNTLSWDCFCLTTKSTVKAGSPSKQFRLYVLTTLIKLNQSLLKEHIMVPLFVS